MNERQPNQLYESKTRRSPADEDLMVIAEQELWAFIRAVTEFVWSRAGKACDRGLG